MSWNEEESWNSWSWHSDGQDQESWKSWHRDEQDQDDGGDCLKDGFKGLPLTKIKDEDNLDCLTENGGDDGFERVPHWSPSPLDTT